MLTLDQNQQQLVSYLQCLQIEYTNKYKNSFFKKKIIKLDSKLGLYIYGGVGRGKTMIVKEFYHNLATDKKSQYHLHEFILYIQNLYIITTGKNPLNSIVTNLKKKYDFIYLDEFEIKDIATAMMIAKILSACKKVGIFIITTSNHHPQKLYQQGLMRTRLLPTLDYIENNFKLYNLDGNIDYRLQSNTSNSTVYHKKILLPCSQQYLVDTFAFYHQRYSLSQSTKPATNIKYNQQQQTILINNRAIEYQQLLLSPVASISFDCSRLCQTNRSVADYINLCHLFTLFMINQIPQFDCYRCDLNYALRFSWLIDIIYDQNKEIIISSAHSLDNIYINDDKKQFTRTVSRLKQLTLDN